MLARVDQKTLLFFIGLGVVLGGILLWVGGGIKIENWQVSAPVTTIIGAALLLVTLALVVIAFCAVKDAETRQVPVPAVPSTEAWKPKMLLILMILGALVVGGMSVWIGWGIRLQTAGPETTLPLIVILGVVVMLVTLALVAVTFSLLNLTDRGQALALPEGSVRAVIALMLLVVFAIVSIYLYSHVASDKATDAGTDIAKQLIVLLGTLVTAVASFYFGSSSVSSARDAADRAQRMNAGPNATGVDVDTLPADGVSRPLKITGVNLKNVQVVKLVSADGKDAIMADVDSVRPDDTTVACAMTVTKDASEGVWYVEVSDDKSTTSRVPKGITIQKPVVRSGPAETPKPKQTVPPAPQPDADADAEHTDAAKPEPKDVDPTNLTLAKADQPFKVLGAALGKVDGVKLTREGADPIQAKGIDPSNEVVKCVFDVPAGKPRGPWDVVVSVGAVEAKPLKEKVTLSG